ncbi:MAG: Gfo/Idh/MocA family oxidoreductase [Clostridia bacterium]|nr:Gfo/Idh/MocA family oxidoreductase [Clostridia bacterium]
MEKKSLKIGMLGFGSMGRTHTFVIKNLPFFYPDLGFDVEVAGVCTTTIEKSKRVCDTYGIKIATVNEDDLIYSPDIDIIDVCTPNIFHFDTLMKALDAGKHIYCEKPLCITYEQARIVAEKAREKNVTCGVVFHNRHMAPLTRAKQLVDEGRIGRILSFHAVYYHSSCADPAKKAGWKQNKDICGGGVLFDLGSHVLDTVTYLCGDVESVMGMEQIAYPTRLGMNGETWQTNADEAFYMLCRLPEGGCGTIVASKVHTGTNDDLAIEIYGERGALKYSLMDPNWLYFYDNTTPDAPIGGERGFTRIECVGRYEAPGGVFPSPKAPAGWLRAHSTSYMKFLSAVDRGKKFSPDFDQGARVQRIMEAAYRSAELGRFVDVGEIR